MAYTTINKSSEHFNTKLYTGNGGTQSITGVGFQPDWCWIKNRNQALNHVGIDAVRGLKYLYINDTGAEGDYSSAFTSFDSDGFSVGATDNVNGSGNGIAAWNWKANGAGSANTDGSISSTVSANTTSGFSIVKYTGTGSAGATVGHGLGVKPAMIIFKSLSVAGPSWVVYHQSKGATYTLYLNETSVGGTSAEMLNNTEPTSSLITLGNGTSSNSSGASTIAYCFNDVQGFSKMGSYTGNNNDDGTFVYLGFKPAFVLIKITSGQTDNWIMQDNKINSFNGPSSQRLRPNSSGAEFSSSNEIDLLSNGFKVHGADGEINGDGFSYIYMSFAENPFTSSAGTPVTAR